MLEIKDLVKSYGASEPVLKGLNFSTQDKHLTAIIGSSGAGKSTMLRCINRLVTANSGQILLDGVDLLTLKGKALQHARRKIGMIFQAYNLIDRLTVMENVLSGRLGYIPFLRGAFRKFPQEDIDHAYALLKRVGLSQYVNKRCDELSGGERQRVGAARALMQNPSILLADEPTASLDPKTSERIMELIAQLTEELHLPVLINLHNVAQAKQYAARIVGLRGGVIVFDGKPDELTDEHLEKIYADKKELDEQLHHHTEQSR
ncbi:phosphonate ABC transporter ATP-binding protein [Marispirochaeta aestuarii]|uniref:Phosphonate ABC transporter ATP-binding protein n=1 Tax=Marispirochaeta aestuarii TaxID=1963862 RepID=A0A1Y1S1Z4_9SPIO|nr:phosphonate ABC transporter ATP-binding protein [Marispirochaeta aestuarii]